MEHTWLFQTAQLQLLEPTRGVSRLPVTPVSRPLTPPIGLCGHMYTHTYTQKYFIDLHEIKRLNIAKPKTNKGKTVNPKRHINMIPDTEKILIRK